MPGRAVRPYQVVLTSSAPVKNIEDCAPPEVSRVLRDLDRINVYWDAVLLHDRLVRLSFICALAVRGLVSYRRRIRSRVVVFFV